MKIYNSLTLSLVHSVQAHASVIWRIKQSPFNNGEYLATCSGDSSVKIWSTSDWTQIRTYSQHLLRVTAIEWLDNDTLASCGETEQTIQIWSVRTGETRRTIGNIQYVYCLKLLNNKIHLAAGVGGIIKIFNINDGSLVSSFQGHTWHVLDLIQLRESGDLLASAGGNDFTVKIWNLTINECKFTLQGHSSYVWGLKQIDSQSIASGSEDTTIIIWSFITGQSLRTLTGHTNGLFFSLDLIHIEGGQTTRLTSGSTDQRIKTWNWSTGECVSTIETNSSICALAVLNEISQSQPQITSTMKTSGFCFFNFYIQTSRELK
jgi:WD40 repeat protein